jgi:hypothetical protein
MVYWLAGIIGVVGVLSAAGLSHAAQNDISRLILDEQRIEGKIRRPQLVLIKAETRPSFGPILMEASAQDGNIVRSANDALIEQTPHDGPFRFSGADISNYKP